MIATLSWAPLKNSGFRSIGMSFVALLVVIDPHPIGVKRSVFFGDPASSVTPRSNRLPAATELPRHRPLNIAGSVQTKKHARIRLLLAFEVPNEAAWQVLSKGILRCK